MPKLQIFNAILLLHISILLSCSNQRTYGEDPQNGECIFMPAKQVSNDDFFNTEECISASDAYESNEEFTKTVETSDDKFKLIKIEHNSFADTEYYQLYSPNGNLRLIASGAQEACALTTAYRIDYNADGYVSNVSLLGNLEEDTDYSNEEEDFIETMKRCLYTSIQNNTGERYEIKRDENNEITSIGTIEIPYGYKAKYKIAEWGPFWTSDISGGELGFFVLLENQETDGSYLNYLYYDNKLIAELAYWKGTFIKARTYNSHGTLVAQYSDRDLDILSQTYSDYNTSSKWYIDKE